MNISLTDISIDLGGKQAKRVLDKVSFEAREGELLSLLGASGAGKSTLLKVIAGILIQDKGSVAFGGKAIDGLPAHKRKVGVVFQDMRLFPHMNVEENVAFPCKMAGMPKKERLLQAQKMLEHVYLEGFGSRDVMTLSGGQQQRVALARALAAQPQVLLLDEPFSGLDESLRDEMRSLVLRLHKAFDITTILVTHDAIEALEMSDRIVYVSAGQVIQQGSPKELFSEPASHEIASCFGECSVLSGIVEEGQFRRGNLNLAAPGCPAGDAVAVVRYGGINLEAAPDDGLKLKCSIYRGEDYLLRLDVAGQTLTVPFAKALPSGSRLSVRVPSESYFIYPK